MNSIYSLSISLAIAVFRADTGVREVSLTAPPPTNAAGRQLTSADGALTEEDFYHAIDENLTKVENFTLEKVTSLRAQIAAIEKEVNAVNSDDEKAKDTIRNKADSTAKAFLTLEKYVNSKLDC
jgi:outer membrane murein-binding lipoprotein Lpp